MAKPIIPNPLDRRHLIEKPMDQNACLKIAEAYMEEGRVDEAIDFFAKAEATDRLESIRADAIETGNSFVVQSVSRVTGDEVASEQWLRCAEVAEAQGMLRYAEVARRQATRGVDASD